MNTSMNQQWSLRLQQVYKDDRRWRQHGDDDDDVDRC
jgi:hypothetical protein